MSLKKLSIKLWAAFAIGAAITPMSSFAQKEDTQESPVIQTEKGAVRGSVTRDKIQQFLGIPYAKAPIGKLRWMPPQPVEAWEGVKNTTEFSSACPQVTTLGPFAGPTSANEDCLYLNVFTSGETQSLKPVIVWIHGGGNFAGSSTDYDPTPLVQGKPDGQQTVVVTFNYRLGLFGTLSTPSLNTEGHAWGNYGVLDQIAVLKWVKQNIAKFGGDPERVALGGQSAGAYDTVANMLSPLSEGLFNRAIVMSSPGFAAGFPTATDALNNGTSFAKAAGCDANDADCLRNLSTARILQLQGAPNMNSPFITGTPFVDGTIIPLQPEDAWNTGNFNKMPVMGGSATFFTGVTEYYSAPLFYGPSWKPMYKASFSQTMKPGEFCLWCSGNQLPDDALEHYSLSQHQNDPMEAYQRLLTDIAKCQEQRVLTKWTAQIPVYAYDFTYNDAPFYFPKMPGFKPGASHTADIQFVFRHFHGGQLGVNVDQKTGLPRELNSQEQKLADQMVGMWTHFAATGNPNGSGEHPWPRLRNVNDGHYLVQNLNTTTMSSKEFREKYQCDYWDMKQ
ncbi:MAG: carboxylesterase/lipase family protein [Vibrio sp.]